MSAHDGSVKKAPVTLLKVKKMAPLVTKTNGILDDPPMDTWDAILFQFGTGEDWFIINPTGRHKPRTIRIITEMDWRNAEVIEE